MKKLNLHEMVNLSSKRTGLENGFIQIKMEQAHPKFPHLHFVYNLKQSRTNYAKFSIMQKENDIKLIELKNIKLSKNQIENIKEFISKNFTILKDYYIQGDIMMDTDEFLNKLEKI